MMNRFTRLLNAILPMPTSGLLLLVASMGSLVFAAIMQYGFNVQPCILCLWQRVPFAVVTILALTACLWRPYGHHTRIVLILSSLVFAVGAGLAIFHTGVELHWWLGTSGCSITPLHGDSVEDIRTQLLHTVSVRCDEISWTFLGLSMANWNVPFSSGLAVFSFMASLRNRGRK